MRPVWLSDDLMVSPSAVAGLVAGADNDSYGPSVGVGRWISVVFVGAAERQVWSTHVEVPIGEGGAVLKAAVVAEEGRQRSLAEAEMLRLSELLWPSSPDTSLPAGVVESSRQCGAMSNAGYRCELSHPHPMGAHWAHGQVFTRTDHL